MTQFRINEYGTLKVVSADKMPPMEAVKEGHTEKDGDSEVAPPSRDNPIVAQGKGTMMALVGWVPPSSRCCLVSPWVRQMSAVCAVLPCASLLLLSTRRGGAAHAAGSRRAVPL